jgi:hypothetical protein
MLEQIGYTFWKSKTYAWYRGFFSILEIIGCFVKSKSLQILTYKKQQNVTSKKQHNPTLKKGQNETYKK